MISPNNRWLEPIASELTGQLKGGQVTVAVDADFARLLQRSFRPGIEADGRLEFERLLKKDFIPRGRPSKWGMSGGVPRLKGLGAAAADDAIGWLTLWAALVDATEEWQKKKAKELGLTLEQWHMMKDDMAIIGILTAVAEQTLTDAELDLEKERRRKRTNVKRTRIWGYSRKLPT